MQHIKLTTKSVMALVCFGLSFSAMAATQFVLNGNFETLGTGPFTNTFASWNNPAGTPITNEVSTAPLAISGSYSALISGHYNSFTQVVGATNLNSDWEFDLDFACSAPGNTTGRTFDLQLDNSGTVGYVRCRVIDSDNNGVGELQLIGTAWTTIFANAVTYSANDTSSASLKVNHLKIVGHYTNSTPTFDFYLTNALGVGYSLAGSTEFWTAAPAQGAGVIGVEFPEGNLGGFEIVDNVSLTASTNSSVPPPMLPIFITQPVSQT